MPLPRPCLDCNKLTTNTRCPSCRLIKTREWDAQRDPLTRLHYKGDYAKRAKAVRESAGPCWICGEHDRLGDPWQADHVDAGNPESLLLKAHRSCNIRRGDGGVNRRGGPKLK
jgi:hypothetical protein